MVQSFARPRANVTGTSTDNPASTAKSVELLKTLLPHLSRLAILSDKSTPPDMDARPFATHAAQTLGI
jgi:ABC-type uncharacterized transport system substrate-binding protein